VLNPETRVCLVDFHELDFSTLVGPKLHSGERSSSGSLAVLGQSNGRQKLKGHAAGRRQGFQRFKLRSGTHFRKPDRYRAARDPGVIPEQKDESGASLAA
jgi:hypothetical protein